jgi:hypothetical protein
MPCYAVGTSAYSAWLPVIKVENLAKNGQILVAGVVENAIHFALVSLMFITFSGCHYLRTEDVRFYSVSNRVADQ